MNEFVLPALPVIGSGTGWAAFVGLAIYVVRLIVNGKLITQREAEFREKRIAALESANQTQGEQINVLVETTRPAARIMEALTTQGDLS